MTETIYRLLQTGDLIPLAAEVEVRTDCWVLVRDVSPNLDIKKYNGSWMLRMRAPSTLADLDNAAVDRFAAAMKDRLARMRDNGRGGWNDKNACAQEFLSWRIIENVYKGDTIDAANYCMFLWNRDERIKV